MGRLTLRLAAVLALAAAAGAQNTLPLFQPGAVRALIFSGRNNHDWRTTTPFLRDILLATGRFDVRVVEEPAGTTASTLDAYDVLILDYNGPRWGEATEKAVEAFVRSGKGLVAVHAASYAFAGLPVLGDRHVRTSIVEPPWPAYARIVGGQFSDQPPKTGHGQRHSFRVKFADREHPIARGLGESFIATDELYHNMRMQPDAKVLATAFDDPAVGGTGRDEPILWTVAYGQGRVFHTTLGHDLAAMREPGFISTFARGAEWAAAGRVSLPAAISLDRKHERPVRTLVVTGGHDHDATFYPIFEGQPDIAATVNPHPLAYRNDLRKRYDAIVMYDMMADLEEPKRQNLRAFVESGKGVVVVHHAIANYPGWPWWYEEVVGGRYHKQSTYKHDEELFVQPVPKHPITDGLGPLHIIDETYKGMWISPSVTVLLKTNNPTSDGPVAWISPYKNSRVVYIQLGHDRQAHLHPGFQRLLRNALLWSAARL